jgi:hypothetical protein
MRKTPATQIAGIFILGFVRGDARYAGRHAQGMDEPTQDELFLDAVDAVVLDALARIGDDPKARFAFFKRLLAVAQEVAGKRKRGQRVPRMLRFGTSVSTTTQARYVGSA